MLVISCTREAPEQRGHATQRVTRHGMSGMSGMRVSGMRVTGMRVTARHEGQVLPFAYRRPANHPRSPASITNRCVARVAPT